MKQIVISSSMKYVETIKHVIKTLEGVGLRAIFPNIDSLDDGVELTMERSKQLALEHFEAIKHSDIVYFIVPNGYMGTSCKLELGYAIALNKTIAFSELTNDIALDCYPKQIIGLAQLSQLQSI